MKTQNRFLRLVLLVVLTLGLTSCSKDEVVPPVQIVDTDKDGIADADDNCPSEAGPTSNQGCPETNGDGKIELSDGISADEFDTYPGDIGFILDTREIVKKGYLPTEAVVTVDAAQGNYSQTIAIDPISFMGQIKIPLEGFTDAAIAELRNGVNVSSVIKVENGNDIIDPAATVSFQANPNVKTVNVSNIAETLENATLKFNEGTFYYFQPVDADGIPRQGRSMGSRGEDQGYVMTIASGAEFNGNEPVRNFSFVPIPNQVNTFAVRIKSGERFIRITSVTNTVEALEFYTHDAPTASDQTNFNAIQDNVDFHFKIEKIDTGIYELHTHDGTPIRVAPGLGLTIEQEISSSQNNVIVSEPISWRLISTSVDWEVQNVGTTFLEPILGGAKTSFGFNSTLTNCGQGNLRQTIGGEVLEEEIITIGWEESLSINTTNTVGVSTTVGVEFDAKFFGVGASYNASITADYEYSRSVGQSSSNFRDSTNVITKRFFSEREVTVPSGSASLVYDALQFYENTKVNFVQRLRISGVDSDSGMPLSGYEIRSQFQLTGFNGVISQVEPTSIVITLRGTALLNKIIETESNVQDVDANCGG